MKIYICTKDQFRSSQGIHLNSPDLWYFRDALETADKDGFTAIYCHYETVGTANYVIPYDVLEYASKHGYILTVLHPAETERHFKNRTKSVSARGRKETRGSK